MTPSPQQVQPYPYDLTKAKQLMAQSGYPNGFKTTLQYPSGFAYYNRLALILQAAWQQIGVNVKLIQQDQGTYLAALLPDGLRPDVPLRPVHK